MLEQAISPRLKRIKERERKSESPIREMVRDSLKRIGVNFRQQEPIGPFWVDFYLPDLNVILECNGNEFHDSVRDGQRDEYMRERGYRIFRIMGSEINHSSMRTVLRVLDDITGNSEYSNIIPRMGYGTGQYCEGRDNCPECRLIKKMDKGFYEEAFDDCYD